MANDPRRFVTYSDIPRWCVGVYERRPGFIGRHVVVDLLYGDDAEMVCEALNQLGEVPKDIASFVAQVTGRSDAIVPPDHRGRRG